MGEDEQKAFEILDKNRKLQRPVIEQYGGNWIKELGDGVLASFSTVSDAVYAAIKIQQSCNVTKEFLLRIGIHHGEVVFEEDDIFGDVVNIASRIQALAPIGGIWVSESIYKNISNKKDIDTFFVREEKLKNVREPVKIYEVRFEDEGSYSKNTVRNSNKRNNIHSSKRKKTVFGIFALLYAYPFFERDTFYDLVRATPAFKKFRQKVYERNERYKADLYKAIKEFSK